MPPFGHTVALNQMYLLYFKVISCVQSLLWSNRNSLFCFFQISHSLLPATYLAFDSLEFVLCSFHLLSFSSFSTLLPIGPSLDFNIGFHPSLLPPECAHFLVLPRPYPSAKPHLLQLHVVTQSCPSAPLLCALQSQRRAPHHCMPYKCP